jgi:hypothetical protein
MLCWLGLPSLIFDVTVVDDAYNDFMIALFYGGPDQMTNNVSVFAFGKVNVSTLLERLMTYVT